MAQIWYWIAHPTGSWPGTPTGAQIVAGNLSSGSAADYAGSETAPGSSSGTLTEATPATGATAGASYTGAAVVYDDVALTYSNVVTGTWTQANDVEIAGSVGVAAASGVTGSISIDVSLPGAVGVAAAMGVSGSASQATDIAAAVGIAAAAGVTGSASQATTIAGSVGVAAAAGVAGEASITNDITISGAVGVAAATGVVGEATVGSDITIGGSVGVAAAAGVAGVPGVAIAIPAAVGVAAAAGVTGLADIGVLIDGAVGSAAAAGVTGSLSLEIIIVGVVGNAVAAGTPGSPSVSAEPDPEPTTEAPSNSYAVGALLDSVRERDPREVRRLMRKTNDEAEVLAMIRSLFDQGAFDEESTLQ